MARAAAIETEIARRRHEPPAEVVLPDPVGDHAGWERIGSIGDPGGEPFASLCLRGIGWKPEVSGDCGDRREAGWTDDLAGGGDAASLQEGRRRRLHTDADIRHSSVGCGSLRFLLQRVDPRGCLGMVLPLVVVKTGEDLLLRKRETSGPESCSHLVVVERPVVEGGLEDLAVEKAVAGTMVPQTDEDRRRPLVERAKRCRGDIRSRVALAVTVERDAVVGPVDRCDMDRLPGRRGFLGGFEIVGSCKATAAGDPLPRLSLAKHDRVEVAVGCALDRYRRPATLSEIGEHHPGLERLFPDRFGKRGAFEVGLRLLGEPEPVADDHGAAAEEAVGRCGAFTKSPADEGQRARGQAAAIRRAYRSPLRPFAFEGGDRRPLGGHLFVPHRRLPRACLDLGRGRDRSFPVLDAVEDGLDAEIVLLRHRIEFMGMTAGTVERQAEECLADDADHVLHLFLARDGTLRGIGLGVTGPVPGTADEHARGDDAVARHRFEDIAGQLLAHELIVGLVVIEALDHVIAVVPGAVARVVVFKSLALGVADDVEPVTPPTLAVVGGGKEVVDEAGIRGLRGIGQERLDLLRARREADEIEEQSTDQDMSIGWERGGNAGLSELVEHPGINRTPRPWITRCLGEWGFRERLERPPIPSGTLRGADGERIERPCSPGSTSFDPVADDRFLVGGKRLLGGHLVALHPRKQQALSVPRFERRPALSPLGRTFDVDERQPAIGARSRVALQTAGDQQRRDLPVEVECRRRWFSSRVDPRRRRRSEGQKHHKQLAEVHRSFPLHAADSYGSPRGH